MLPTISPDHQHKIHYLPARSDITNPPPLPPSPPAHQGQDSTRLRGGRGRVCADPDPSRVLEWTRLWPVFGRTIIQAVRPLSWRAHR